MPAQERRIAAIDIGTNSIHMIVAELRRDGGYRVVDKEKEMVQLGLSSLGGAPLSDEAMDRGVAAIARMAEVARGWKVDEIVAVATSAVREAPNRRDFLRRVKEASDVRVKVISGEEEADYIYRAVRSAVDLDGGSTLLCIDIGGGSVELVVGTAREIYYTASEPLGSLRMAQRFHLEETPRPQDIESCRLYTAEHLRKVSKRINLLGFDMCVGTSGTIQALTNLAAPAGETTTAPALRTLAHGALQEVVRILCRSTLQQRVEGMGIDPKRARNIVAGAVVLDQTMRSLRIPSLLVCSAGIREGIVESRLAETPQRSGNSLRRKSSLALVGRSDCDKRHARHVAKLALRIFDQTRMLHALPDEAREMLEHAALLHETGMQVSDRGYHKHTYYLIRHAQLRGFTDQQLILVANVARYHRKSPPADEHPNLEELTPPQRGDVEKLAAILRIAEALDRSHTQSVRDVAVRFNGNVRFAVRTRSDAAVEIAAATKRAKYFASLFETKVRIEAS
jgi:exopolyphosphatase / guanosine-5'-triphosphate,3'-diphosphate pyrophosphatase